MTKVKIIKSLIKEIDEKISKLEEVRETLFYMLDAELKQERKNGDD